MKLIEEFGLKLNKQVVLVVAVCDESKSTDGYKSLEAYLKQEGCVELVPSCFLIGKNHVEILRKLEKKLDFMKIGDSAIVFNKVMMESGARIWAPKRNETGISISGFL